MMKQKFLAIFIVISTVLFSMISIADELDQAIFDINRGEFKSAISTLEPLVIEGYSPAQYYMALMYKEGTGIEKNLKKAFDLFGLSAEQNYPEAQFDLALMYSEGEVVKKDLKKAFTLTEKAASKELASAQFNLAVMYYNGQGVRRDYYKASRHYELAAMQNYTLAQFNLALMYFEGKGVEKSTEMSFVWNIIAASNGYEAAGKSRDMDQRKLTSAQIKTAQVKADDIYRKIVEYAERKAKIASKSY